MSKFIGCDAKLADAKIVLFGAPYDATSTYRKGSALAPAAIRKESFGIETYSPYLNRDLADIQVHDAGDLKFKSADPAPMVCTVQAKTAGILEAGKFPLLLGGEHLVTLGAFRAIHQKYPDVCIVHFDAHTDLREDWNGQKLNHSTVIRRCHDLIAPQSQTSATEKDIRPVPRIFQFGIRSGERIEFGFAEEFTHLCKNDFKTLQQAIKQIGKRPVYFTVDLDILDPSEFGGTGTPEAGGVTFLELLTAAKEVFTSLNVVGCDINELSPPCDKNGASTALACKFLREVLLLIR